MENFLVFFEVIDVKIVDTFNSTTFCNENQFNIFVKKHEELKYLLYPEL